MPHAIRQKALACPFYLLLQLSDASTFSPCSKRSNNHPPPDSYHATDKAEQQQYIQLYVSSRASICKGAEQPVFLVIRTPCYNRNKTKRKVPTGTVYSRIHCTTMRHPGDRLSLLVRHRREAEPKQYLVCNDRKRSQQRSTVEVDVARIFPFLECVQAQFSPYYRPRRLDIGRFPLSPSTAKPPRKRVYEYSIVCHATTSMTAPPPPRARLTKPLPEISGPHAARCGRWEPRGGCEAGVRRIWHDWHVRGAVSGRDEAGCVHHAEGGAVRLDTGEKRGGRELTTLVLTAAWYRGRYSLARLLFASKTKRDHPHIYCIV